jgi:hypothetical protein
MRSVRSDGNADAEEHFEKDGQDFSLAGVFRLSRSRKDLFSKMMSVIAKKKDKL